MAVVMTEEKREKLRQLEQEYLERIQMLTAEYRAEIGKIMDKATMRKLQVVREKLAKK
jgi:hypothetical protein